MNNFRMGNLDDWQSMDIGVPVLFAVADGPDQVTLNLLASDPVDIYADGQLVGTGSGNIRVRFTAHADFELSAQAKGEGTAPEVWLRGRREPQVIAEGRVPSFTTIEPAGPRPGDDLRRMMHFMALNQQRREAALRDEIARLGEAYQSVRRAADKPAGGVEEAPAGAGDGSEERPA